MLKISLLATEYLDLRKGGELKAMLLAKQVGEWGTKSPMSWTFLVKLLKQQIFLTGGSSKKTLSTSLHPEYKKIKQMSKLTAFVNCFSFLIFLAFFWVWFVGRFHFFRLTEAVKWKCFIECFKVIKSSFKFFSPRKFQSILIFWFSDNGKSRKSFFLFDSVSDVHVNRRSLHHRLCSLQLRLLFLRKPKERKTPCCQLTQGMTCYLFHWFVCLLIFLLKEGITWGMAGRTKCGTNFYLLPASLQTVCFHWTWQLTIFAQFIVCFPRIQQVLTTKY